MRIFCLRTIYDTTNLGFSDEHTLVAGTVAARFVRQCEMPVTIYSITGLAAGGKRRISVTTEDRAFRGRPLLLEILATDQTADETTAADIRPQLESRTAELAALLTWSLPGTVGAALGDALFSRDPDGLPNEWMWNDVERVTVADFFPEFTAVKCRHADVRRALQGQCEERREAVITAMRWWRHALSVGSPVDRFVAYWIVIETVSAHVSKEDSIRSRVGEALTMVFPGLARVDAGRVKRMTDILYQVRCKALHGGRRHIAHLSSLVEVAQATASACIMFLVDDSVSPPPPRDNLLHLLGV